MNALLSIMAAIAIRGAVTYPATIQLAEGAAGGTHASQSAAYAAAEFNQTRPGNATVALIGDTHLDPTSRVYATPTLDDRLVDTINALLPLPEHLIIAGDSGLAPDYFGYAWNAAGITNSTAEMTRAKAQYLRFDSRMTQHLMLGNHDQHANEEDGALWKTIFTAEPTYKRLDIEGVPFLFLNGHHDGSIDATQEAWLQAQVDGIGPAREVVIIHHQPVLGSRVSERMSGVVLARVFSAHTAKLWLFAGHVHGFYRAVRTMGLTTLMEYTVTTANALAFNDGKNPGFYLIAISNGTVARVWWRDCKASVFNDYACLTRAGATTMERPWDGVTGIILELNEGSYDRPTYFVSALANDTGTWWAYLHNITYKLPLSGGATKVRFLAGYIASATFRLSTDGVTWTDVTPTWALSVWTLAIPAGMQGSALIYAYAKIGTDAVPLDRYDVGWAVGGVALTT